MNIDRIAREMVDGEPSADLEARIRARLSAAAPERHAAWWTWRVGAPLGALAAIALAVVVQGPGSRVQGLPTEAQSANVGPGVVISSQLPYFPTSQLPNFPTSQLSKIPPSQLSAAELAWMERRMPALDPVNALHMDRLSMDSIQPEPLAITPLTMTPVSTEGAGTERRNDR